MISQFLQPILPVLVGPLLFDFCFILCQTNNGVRADPTQSYRPDHPDKSHTSGIEAFCFKQVRCSEYIYSVNEREFNGVQILPGNIFYYISFLKNTGWAKVVYSCEYTKQSLFLHYVLIMLFFSTQTAVNLVLLLPVYKPCFQSDFLLETFTFSVIPKMHVYLCNVTKHLKHLCIFIHTLALIYLENTTCCVEKEILGAYNKSEFRCLLKCGLY